MERFEYNLEMVRLNDDGIDYDSKPTLEDIRLRKQSARMRSKARSKAKLPYCALCGKEVSSFCNSHSVPKFALSRIAENGMVSDSLHHIAKLHDKKLGLNKTGTFQVICDNCDNESFQDYENPNAYLKPPTNKMLAQIALKNYLLMIYKRLVEREFYILHGETFPYTIGYSNEKATIANLDLVGYTSGLKYAQKAIKKINDKYYHLYYYKVLDYVVPYAAQSAITLVSDFNDEMINNLFTLSSEYKTKDIHVAIFPLETTSVIMLFVKDEEKRYRKFYKQFKLLPPEEQLSTINYIVFSNIENVFLNPKVQNDMCKNKQFVEICGLTTNIDARDKPLYNCSKEILMSKVIEEFSLSKRHEIPNLLSKEYAIPNDSEDKRR